MSDPESSSENGETADPREEVLYAFLRDEIPVQATAERLAKVTLEDDRHKLHWPMSSLECTWQLVMYVVQRRPQHLDKLVELLVAMANLPEAKDKNGNAILVDRWRVWADLPTFGWEINHEWNALEIPASGSERDIAIERFLNVNKFLAKLLRTQHPAFQHCELQGLVTMRVALEDDGFWPVGDVYEVFVPAATLFVSIVGVDMYRWEIDYPSGPKIGDVGARGPLYHGKPGFNKERWQFWKTRFAELSKSSEMSEYLREIAAEGLVRMELVEKEVQSRDDRGVAEEEEEASR